MIDEKKPAVTERPLDELVGRFRKFLAKRLARMALRLDPKCPEVAAFYQRQMFDMAVYGGCVAHVDYSKFVAPPNAEVSHAHD